MGDEACLLSHSPTPTLPPSRGLERYSGALQAYLREWGEGACVGWSDNGESPGIPSPERATHLSLPVSASVSSSAVRPDWSLIRGHAPSEASHCKVGAMGSISPTQEDEMGEGGVVCTHMCSKVSQWDRATHIPSLCVGSNAQALGVPQLSYTKLGRQGGSRAPGS